MNVFVHADKAARIKRIVGKGLCEEKKAPDFVTKKDKQRANYYNFYSNKRWDDLLNYDITIDTSRFTIEQAVDCSSTRPRSWISKREAISARSRCDRLLVFCGAKGDSKRGPEGPLLKERKKPPPVAVGAPPKWAGQREGGERAPVALWCEPTEPAGETGVGAMRLKGRDWF